MVDPSRQAPGSSAGPPPTIFVIDDDDVVRDSMKALLEARRFTVRDFSSGREFLQGRDDLKADCVVLDVHMPSMTGLEVVKELRKTGDTTPVLLVTGDGNPGIYAQARALGVPLLEKPMSYRAFFAAIDQAIAAHPPLEG